MREERQTVRDDDGDMQRGIGATRLSRGRRVTREHTPRFRSLPEWWKDPALALFSLFLDVSEWASGSQAPLSLIGLGLALAGSAALLWRVRLGGERLLAIAVVTSIGSALVKGPDAGFVALAALYTIGTTQSWRYTLGACAVAIAAEGLNGAVRAGFRGDPIDGLAALVGVAAVTVVPAAIGLYLGARRAYVRSLIDRAEDLERERELLERERELLAREAVSVERARIARELHDVVAHHVSVMVIQAGAAEAQLPPNAAASAQAIAAIRETGREALTEMRRLLGLLRDEARAGHGTDNGQSPAAGLEARMPQPGLADLPVLVARMREAGVDATLEYAGAERLLPSAIDLSLFRIAQEALTNTLRHAGAGTRARLRITFDAASVTLEAVDDGPARPVFDGVEPAGVLRAGHGLVGMRERVALFDGAFEAGVRRGGGFRVEARFPLEPAVPLPVDVPLPGDQPRIGDEPLPEAAPLPGEAALVGGGARTISPDESAGGAGGPGSDPTTSDPAAAGRPPGAPAPPPAAGPDAGGSFDGVDRSEDGA